MLFGEAKKLIPLTDSMFRHTIHILVNGIGSNEVRTTNHICCEILNSFICCLFKTIETLMYYIGLFILKHNTHRHTHRHKQHTAEC